MSKKDTTAVSDAAKSSIWGGRFSRGPSQLMQDINASIAYDKQLYRQDIDGSKAHATMLATCGIISDADCAAIHDGLTKISTEIETGEFVFSAALEDIHMNVESRLADLIGEPARRLHTARSRNDQVATDFKLWVRASIDALDDALAALQEALLDKADEHCDTIMPGFTHLQTAQPVTFGFHLMAYVEMLGRDRGRLIDARVRLNESPLGAAALAGTSFPIDRHQTAELLGFDRPAANAMDAVSDRDFALELLAAASICAVHLSRLAEEMVIWSSDRFAFISLSDAFTTGSSIMPQKRNPDAAELVRAKPGRIIGSLNGLLIVLKGLPLAYGKDMQEDKEGVFDAVDSLAIAIAATSGMVRDMTANKDAMRAALTTGFPTATDLADYMVRELGLPFREAHHASGSIVALAAKKGCDLDALSLAEMQTVEPRIKADIMGILTVESAVAARTSFGGTAPTELKARIADARSRFNIKG
ncbi:argininosuccinate lyase [Candidatus Puniceispirillum sp.]|jgi:argininosuccinate lyase|uniref:argininosuccinate lyase n=1 Tax=Candidatus Puniceispirillum sp. TaxID=2026719 RepID=UPI001ED38DDB|nr:argininosuccinate lyase [Candidatus Puniceispirillum sp.]